ncbi:Trafficking protein particle complex subunit 5 [Ascosphaera acerosa]|nr:Trafficking protein particle complex subunit 5 [Ascosphaera acerosa]
MPMPSAATAAATAQRHQRQLSSSTTNTVTSPSTGAGAGAGGAPASLAARPNPNRKTIYDRNLNRTRNAELSKASFALLFSEMVAYAQRRVTGIQDLERRLNEQGYPLGLRLLDLLFYRTQPASSSSSSSSSLAAGTQPVRPLRILPLLQLIHGPLWRLLFGRAADALEHSIAPDKPNEYMITDNDPLVNSYISVPKEMSMLNCAAYVAGIIEGVCDGCGFEAKVSAHNQASEMWPCKTVFLVRFEPSVMEREKVLERQGVK